MPKPVDKLKEEILKMFPEKKHPTSCRNCDQYHPCGSCDTADKNKKHNKLLSASASSLSERVASEGEIENICNEIGGSIEEPELGEDLDKMDLLVRKHRYKMVREHHKKLAQALSTECIILNRRK